MTEIQVLNILFTMEQVFCVYRNFRKLKNMSKRIVCFLISILIVIYCSNILFQLSWDLRRSFHYNIPKFIFLFNCHVVSATVSLLAIVDTVKRAKSFEELSIGINSTYRVFKHDRIYTKSLKRLTVSTIVWLVCLVVNFVASVASIVLNDISGFLMSTIHMKIIRLMRAFLIPWHELQMFVGLITFSCMVKVIGLSLKHLNTTLSVFSKDVDNFKVYMTRKTSCCKFRVRLNMIVLIYNKLTVSADKLSDCSGSRIVLTLFNLTLFVIYFSFLFIVGVTENKGYLIYIGTKFIFYLVAVINVLGSCQRLQNQYNAFRTHMSQINNTLLSGDFDEIIISDGIQANGSYNGAFYQFFSKCVEFFLSVGLLIGNIKFLRDFNMFDLPKQAKDFSRKISMKPVEIKLLSNMTVQMSLLLIILSTAVSYTIVLLQFSHIV